MTRPGLLHRLKAAQGDSSGLGTPVGTLSLLRCAVPSQSLRSQGWGLRSGHVHHARGVFKMQLRPPGVGPCPGACGASPQVTTVVAEYEKSHLDWKPQGGVVRESLFKGVTLELGLADEFSWANFDSWISAIHFFSLPFHQSDLI